GFDTVLFERVLLGEGVDARSEHLHVVGRRPVHSLVAVGGAPPDVAAAYDDAHLRVQFVHRPHPAVNEVANVQLQVETGVARQGLAAELEDDPAVDGLWLHAPVTLLRVFLAPPHDSSQKARQSRERVTPPAERRPAPAAHPLIPAAKGITVSK